ncbi:MAG: peptidoglycan DD-metalloendopeptidase family protein [Actinomycetaceae bacterium]|nr:peptidoglycan DD-metalloendopeptidase family protein [Actinomycetaceae bacterium]MDY5854593.1 peptidoglycan DD-metalloendopeptidase family protein [Arcanobacterium sp.]
MMRSFLSILVAVATTLTAISTGTMPSSPQPLSADAFALSVPSQPLHPRAAITQLSEYSASITIPAATPAAFSFDWLPINVKATGNGNASLLNTAKRDTSTATPHSNSYSYGNSYSWPTGAPAPVIHPYAPGPHNWDAGHRGVDLAANNGTDIFAATDGTVIYAGALAQRGVVSILDAHGIRTTYEPIKPTVHAGDHVRRGDLIGTIDGYHCGFLFACLHWGAKRGSSAYMNPLWLLAPPRVRLIE